MQTGLLIQSTGAASQAILFIFRACQYHGRPLNKSPLPCRQLRQNTTLWLMHSKKPFGYGLFWACCVFLFHNLFPFLQTIKLLVLFPLLRLFLLAQNISISAIILFVIMFRPDHFQLHGYRRKICQRTFLQSLFLLLFFIAIVKFLDFLNHPYKFHLFIILFIFLLFHPDGGVLTLGHQIRTSHLVALT